MNIIIEETFLDYPSPDDVAAILFLPGCSHYCKGCQNFKLQEIHDIWTKDEENKIILDLKNMCQRCETNKIVLSGGDPLNPCNRNLTIRICKELCNNFDICIYTGYEAEEVKDMNIIGFKYLKCGKFDCDNIQESKKTDEYIQFINKTQNLFDKNFNQISTNGRYYFSNK